MPLDRLDEEIGELAAHISAATCRWLTLIAEVDRREGFTEWGFGSCSAWLAWRCSLGPAAARDHVRVARALRELPLVEAEFARGALTYSKVRALTRVAQDADEEELLSLARHATAAQLERLVRAYRGVIATEAGEEPRRDDYVSWSWSEDGALEIHGRLPAAEGAVVVKALEAARDQLREGARAARDEDAAASAEALVTEDAAASAEALVTEDAATGAPSNADALTLMAETLLANGARQGTGGERYQVVMHVDRAALGEEAPDGRCEIEDGPGLAPETARRLACDASLITMLEQNGSPLSVGRRTRTIPPAMRRALRSRDGGCRFPGCTQRRFVDAHHIQHWAQGGETKLANLVQLCWRHHHLLHEGGFSVECHGERLRFRRPNGHVVPPVPRARRGDHVTLVRQNRRRGVDVDADTCFPLSAGERFDYGMAVDALLPSNSAPPPAGASAEALDGRGSADLVQVPDVLDVALV
jgi:hypothetical protein